MKIQSIELFQTVLTYKDGIYSWGRGHRVEKALTSVIRVNADTGLVGVGESCPIGGSYLEAHPFGFESALQHLASVLLGQDPRDVHIIERAMDYRLRGHNYVKSAIDIACWDLFGKSVGLPVYQLLGGQQTIECPMYRVVPQKEREESAATMRAYRDQGYRQFQIKVGNNWQEDIENILQAHSLLEPGEVAYADANMGWTIQEAIQVVNAVKHTGIMIEQPCMDYDDCLHVRKRSHLPTKLDECITDIRMAQRAINDQAAEVLCLKLSNLGGFSKARRVRDLAVDNGLSVVSEDTWGGEITTAAVAHFAASTPPEHLFNTTDLCNYNHGSTGLPGPETRNGKLIAGNSPGLGVELNQADLGAPVAIFK